MGSSHPPSICHVGEKRVRSGCLDLVRGSPPTPGTWKSPENPKDPEGCRNESLSLPRGFRGCWPITYTCNTGSHSRVG